MKQEQVIVLGAGISGLATAAFLKQKGKAVIVLEQSSTSGGVITTEKNSGYICDYASNSAIEKNLDIRNLIEWAEITDEVLVSSSESKKRIILRDDKLHALKGPLSVVFTSLISWKGKFRIASEYFRKPRIMKENEDETMATFVKRRFGQELLDYALNPLVAGIYAGKPEHLSMISAYSNMRMMEQNHGSVIAGSIAFMKDKQNKKGPKPSRDILSFKNGMSVLPNAIEKKLGTSIQLSSKVLSVTKENEQYNVRYLQNGKEQVIRSKCIISTVPAYNASNIFSGIDTELSQKLNEIYHPAVTVLNIAYNKSQIRTPLDSYGFLVPEKENKNYLGAIWSSVIYKNRAPKDQALFTLMLGGSRAPDFLNTDQEQWIDKAIEQFQEVMKISGEPIFRKSKLWQKAIPQYNIGHPEIMTKIKSFEKEFLGIILTGNYRDGNGVADCVANAKKIADSIS